MSNVEDPSLTQPLASAAIDGVDKHVTGDPASAPDRPPAYGEHQFLWIAVFTIITAAGTKLFIHTDFGISLVNQWLLYSIVAIGFYLVFCIAGRFAFCQTFMMALAGYTAGYVSLHHSFWVGLIAGVAIVIVVALTFGLLIARTEDFFFAVATLALSEVGTSVFIHWNAFTGPNGLRSNIPPPSVFGHQLLRQIDVLWLFLSVVVGCLILAVFVSRSPLQRDAIVARDNPEVARSCGIPVQRVQLSMFILGSALGGLGGGLAAYWQGSVSTDSFGLTLAIGVFLMPILGGVDSMWGPVAGALFYVELPQILSGLSRFAPLIYGIVLVVTVIAVPDGLIGAGRRAIGRLRGHPAPPKNRRGVRRHLVRIARADR